MMSEGYKKAARHSFRTAWDTTALGLLVGLILVIFSDDAARWLNPRPVPFTDVRLEGAVWASEGNTLRIEASYQKTDEDCVLEVDPTTREPSIVVYGVTGQPRAPLPREIIRGDGQTAQRDPGYQVMRLLVETGGVKYQRYEVVTTHLCYTPDDDDRDEPLIVKSVFVEVPG